MQKTNITCRLDADDVAFLDKLAQITDRDRSYLIKRAVSEFISLQKWRIDEVEAALVEADEGQLASAKDVQKIMRELGGGKSAGSPAD
ncbi:hypothetical protein Mal52_36910 [Symmachiella dynata]|uniref:Ribbon-helix-helix protein CopG domain-containing protein n=1 Tax=Symmachiella dynata TaxID=2527995 RepID=A0A517ZRU4_9PLAN|nr:ribbon-helix-helix protein, CopG family [Symmachiella dynata]QDU45200.1 hypothetical protein Mal52_36910 [Symmachiella dynata]